MISSIIAICGGLLASSSAIIAHKPNAREWIDKITPFLGWLGLVLTFWGIWGIIQFLTNVGNIDLMWTLGLGAAVVEFVVGFLLSFALISKYLLEKNEIARQKGQELRLQLTKYQIPAGFVLLVLGTISLVFIFVYPRV